MRWKGEVDRVRILSEQPITSDIGYNLAEYPIYAFLASNVPAFDRNVTSIVAISLSNTVH